LLNADYRFVYTHLVPSGLAACQPAPAMLATRFTTLSDCPATEESYVPEEASDH